MERITALGSLGQMWFILSHLNALSGVLPSCISCSARDQNSSPGDISGWQTAAIPHLTAAAFKNKQYPSAWIMHQNTRDSRCSGLYSRTLSVKCKRFSGKDAMTPPGSLSCVLYQTAPEPSPLIEALLCFHWKLHSSWNNTTSPPLGAPGSTGTKQSSGLQLTATHIYMTTAKPQEKLGFWSCLTWEEVIKTIRFGKLPALWIWQRHLWW